jgi:hypothetical protein
MRAYLSANKKLYQEIEDRMGVVHGVGDEERAEAEQDDFHDDSDVPLAAVVQQALDLDIGASGDEVPYISDATCIQHGEFGSHNKSQVEAILAYDEAGELESFLVTEDS